MREIGKSVGQRVLARPPDALKRIDKVRPAAQSNKPEASIHRGTKYCILVAEIAKGVRDIARGNFGYVAANYHDGSGGGNFWTTEAMRFPRSPRPCGSLRYR